MNTNRGFDLLSPVYDVLARVVFGRSIVESQTKFLSCIPDNSKILILGGGTGWLLEAIEEKNRSGEIWYVECSAGMINKARNRKLTNTIHFIQGTEEDIPPRKFDVVITNFYLDLFTEKKLKEVIVRINQHTNPTSQWLITDFADTGTAWQQWMLTIMYAFFRIVCSIEGKRLPDWPACLRHGGWMQSNVAYRYGKFIVSSTWNKTLK